MKKAIFAITMLFCVAIQGQNLQTNTEENCCDKGKCNPNGICTACKDCSRCKHCSRDGGSCSVCRGKKGKKVIASNFLSYSKKARESYKTKELQNRKNVSRNTNLRAKPTTKSEVIVKIPAYNQVKVISKKGEWYYVEYEYYDFDKADFRVVEGYVYEAMVF